MHQLFRTNHLKHSNSNDLFQFMALAPFRAKRLQSHSLPCRCYKRLHHNFIAHRSLVPEAGLMLNIHHARPAPFINSRKTFTIPPRLHHHLNWVIQQVHSDNRRYGHEFLSHRKEKKTIFSISDGLELRISLCSMLLTELGLTTIENAKAIVRLTLVWGN